MVNQGDINIMRPNTYCEYIDPQDIPDQFSEMQNLLRDLPLDPEQYPIILSFVQGAAIRAMRVIDAINMGKPWELGDDLDMPLQKGLWRLAFLLEEHAGSVRDADEWYAHLQAAVKQAIVRATGAIQKTPTRVALPV